ncbi:hypothetical protein Efla_006260 [Eimeria flavescens]
MLADADSSSESEAAAELLESMLGPRDAGGEGPSAGPSPGEVKAEKSRRRASAARRQQQTETAADAGGPSAGGPPPQGLALELKGLPLQIHPGCCQSADSASDCMRLQPHQKLLRLSVEGDPTADPAALLSAYLAALKDEGLRGAPQGALHVQYVQVEDAWYSVRRDTCRGELLLGQQPADTQLLTTERHLGQLTFARCEPPQAERNEQPEAEEDKAWETAPSFGRFHKIDHYGANVRPKKPKSRRS